MQTKRMGRWLCAGVLAVGLCGVAKVAKAQDQGQAAAGGGDAAATAAQPAQTWAQLRKEMVAKRAEIRKAEQQALRQNPDLRDQLKQLEQQRRDLMIKANPDLQQLYQDEAQLLEQIRALHAKGHHGRHHKKNNNQ